MTYAERDSIRSVIDGFLNTGMVDEVLVVDNNAQAGTAEEVAKTPARMVSEPAPGLRARHPPRPAGGLRRPGGPGRARRHIPARGHRQAAGLRRRRHRRGVRHPHHARIDLGRREHGLAAALGQLGGGQADRGAAEHQPPERRGVHLPAAQARHGPRGRGVDARGGQPRRGRGDAADDHLGGALRGSAGELPAAGRRLVGDGQAPGRDQRRPADDRADPELSLSPDVGRSGRARARRSTGAGSDNGT